MNILVAPNAFKGSLSSLKVAESIEEGIISANPEATVNLLPVADGGDSTMEVMMNARGGNPVTVTVLDPLQRKIKADYGRLPDNTAIVEMAEASGIRRLDEHEKNPLKTTSYGTGQLIQDALKKGAQHILIGVGGSATVDGGVGLMQALGIQFLDHKGHEVGFGGDQLLKIQDIRLTGSSEKLLGNAGITVICDVDNPLLGPGGAAEVFGPQKGATPGMVKSLEQGMKNLRDVIKEKFQRDIGSVRHGGAAGGIAAGLAGILNARLVPGTEFVLDYIHFHEALKNCDLVMTGEGKLDSQSLEGKAPYGVAQRAKAQNKPVIFIGGAVPGEIKHFESFDAMFSILNGPHSLEYAMKNTENLIKNQVINLMRLLIIGKLL